MSMSLFTNEKKQKVDLESEMQCHRDKRLLIIPVDLEGFQV